MTDKPTETKPLLTLTEFREELARMGEAAMKPRIAELDVQIEELRDLAYDQLAALTAERDRLKGASNVARGAIRHYCREQGKKATFPQGLVGLETAADGIDRALSEGDA